MLCINDKIREYYQVNRRKAEMLDSLLVYLAGDTDRYLTALDEGKKEDVARELENIRARSREIWALLAKGARA